MEVVVSIATILAALAFYYLRASDLPELYLIPLKGSAVALLGVLIIALRPNRVMPLLLAIRNRAQ